MLKRLILAVCVLAALTGPAQAQLNVDPNLDIDVSSVIINTLPMTVGIPVYVTYLDKELRFLSEFLVTVTDGFNPTVTLATDDTPFKNGPVFNVCDSGLLFAPPGGCSVIDTHHATVTVPWTVTAPGTYTFTASVHHGGDEGWDQAQVIVAVITAEYPAPPAVANAYLNSGAVNKKLLTSSVRGCIISQIALNQAQGMKYGPRGGPYDEASIQADALAYFAACQ